MSELNLEIISVTGIVFSGKCNLVTVPCSEGDVGFMAGHEVFVSTLKEGKIEIFDKSNKVIESFDVKGGYVEMKADNDLVILIEAV